MNRFVKYISLLSLVVLASCRQETKHYFEDNIVHVVDFSSLKECKLTDLPHWDNVDYILLRNGGDKELIGLINKVKVLPDQNRIIVMDSRRRALVAYDMHGNFITQIGHVGQGPKEFINLTDFDVDSKGNIYMIDGRLDKLFVYDSSFQCVKDVKLPFEADILCTLGGDSLLYGLSSWNKGRSEGYKIVLSNSKQEIIKEFVPYEESDPGFWISDYLFGKSKDYIAYNQTVDNDVLLFSKQGELKKVFRFDFGNENVPVSAKTNIERQLADYDQYVMLKKILAITDRYIIGFLWEHRQTKMFVLDYQSNVCYKGDQISDLDCRLGCGFYENGLISYIDSESSEYPDSVNEHVRNEHIALQIRYIE